MANRKLLANCLLLIFIFLAIPSLPSLLAQRKKASLLQVGIRPIPQTVQMALNAIPRGIVFNK